MCSNSEFSRVSNVIHGGKIVGSAAAFNRRSQATISMRVDEQGKIYCEFKVAQNVTCKDQRDEINKVILAKFNQRAGGLVCREHHVTAENLW